MTAKLQNCGVIGVRCVFGDVDPRSAQREGVDRMWVAKDAILMFGSDFVPKRSWAML